MMSKPWRIATVVLAAALLAATIGRATAAGEIAGFWFSDACILSLTLNADGTFIHDDGAVTLNGTWRLDGVAVSFSYSDGKQYSGTFVNGVLSVAGCDFTKS